MYSIDTRDRLTEIRDLPQSSVGAPLPHIVATEHVLGLAYLVERNEPGRDGTTVRMVSPTSPDEQVVIVKFHRPHAHLFGPPTDEALAGHPLASRGLRPYAVFEIHESSWIRALERMSRVHPYPPAHRFSRLRHFVFVFHDATFECVAEDIELVGCYAGPMSRVASQLFQLLALDAPAI